MAPGGYHGSYLRIDVSTGTAERVPLAEAVLRRFIGGSGLGAWLLIQETEGGQTQGQTEGQTQGQTGGQTQGQTEGQTNGLTPLIFAFSPLVGSALTTSAKFAVVSESPLTGRINDSLASSGFAIAGKQCGCDAIVIVGRAAQLSTLVIDDGTVRIESAETLRGTTCSQAEATLKAQLGPDYQIASIGPAGEAQVRYATISHDGRHAGRGGSGAVLGRKNIKAIAVRGATRCRWAHDAELSQYAKQLSKRSFGPATAKYRELGTASNLLTFNRLGTLPTRNFQTGTFEGAADIAPEQLRQTHSRTRASCRSCTIGCEHIYSRGDGPAVRLEYESLFALGSLCGVGDADAVLRAARRCDEVGIDTVSTGATIAFAMECAERGYLDEPWLRFGSGEAVLQAIDLIAQRRGVGALLAEGTRRAAIEIGHNSIAFAPQVKGLEIPGYEPRAMQTMALGFAVGTRGADHNRSGAYEVDFSDKVDRRHVTVDAVRHAIESEDKAALMDSLILCKFLRGVFDDFYAEAAEMLNLVTGWDTTSEELRNTAAGIVRTKREFNLMAGWTQDEDTLPARFLDTPLQGDPQAALSRERLDALVAEYHRQRGW